MNFFEDQRLAKQKSNRLMGIFIASIVAISVATGVLLTILLGLGRTYETSEGYNQAHLLNTILSSETLMVMSSITGFVGGVILIISFIKTWRLKSHPEEICESLGAYLVPNNPQDFKLKRYRNIVEEMSIASSVPLPLIYILEDQAINAFACGYDINSAAICVTRGALNALNREELQAVVAHEYSHILNGDMSINLRLIGMLAGLLFIYYAGRFILNSQRHSRRKEGNQIAVIGLVLVILGLVGFLFGNLLKAAISRQREYLADASSVQFTRNPEGITGALKKIAVNAQQGILEANKAEKAAHMFLVDGVEKSFFSLATHPDIYDRIKAVDKSFDKDRFLEKDYEDVIKQMNDEIQREVEEPVTKKDHSFNPKERLEVLVPLFMLLEKSKSISDLGERPEEELLRRFVANEDPEIKKLSSLQKLELLEVAFGEIKSLDSHRKARMHEIVKEEIRRDGKFDFDEFIIYAYLRPALEDVKIKYHKLSVIEFETYGNMALNFMWQMDKIEMTLELRKELLKYFKFKELNTNDIGYTRMVKAFEKLRFSSIEQKQMVLELIDKLVHYNHNVTEKEEVILKIFKQILGVPGSV